MPSITFLGYPLSTLVLYFCVYAFAGWCMETVYCSIGERRFVPRGFLHGPICPIYGIGVLLMILFFQPLAGNIFIFYVVSTVTMSAWEYFVGWFLETTTHMKYWDYSMYRFNLKGRICLWVCLVWGVLSYVCIFFIHPPVAHAIDLLPDLTRQILAIVLSVLILVDTVFTIHELALMTKMMNKLQQLSGEMQVQMSLGRMELGDKLQDAKEAMASLIPDSVSDSSAKLRAKYAELVSAAERSTRRFRHTYAHLSAPRLDADSLRAIRDRARQVKEQRQAKREAKKAAKRS